MIGVLRNALSRLPTPVAVAAGFGFFIAVGLGVAALVPPAKDSQAECSVRCRPLPGNLVEDKTYPLSSRRPYYPLVCKCGSSP